MLGVLLSCADPGQAPLDTGAFVPGLIVSNPVTTGAVLSGSSTSFNSAENEVAYISMPPGTLRGVLSVRIRNLTTNGTPTEGIPVLDGGFDPVAVAARAGDQLALLMSLEGGSVTVSNLTVPYRRSPRVVRTAPLKGRTDVSLSTRPRIVFSEPIDARTLSNATVQLLVGGIAQSGTVTPVAGDALLAEFTPAAPLTPNTVYELLITTGVRDREGDALESSEPVLFTTQASAGFPAVAFLTLSEPPSVVLAGSRLRLSARVLNSNGQVLDDRILSWSSSDSSVATPHAGASAGPANITAWVDVPRSGTATITARVEERSASITFTSVDSSPDSTALAIEAFSLIEYQYPGLPGQWYYAPQLRVREPAGRAGVAVVGISFNIPGIGATMLCTTRRPVAAGLTRDVFQVVSGDFELHYWDPGARATSPDAGGTIYVVGPDGRVSHITVSVPIVAGSPPTTPAVVQPQTEWTC